MLQQVPQELFENARTHENFTTNFQEGQVRSFDIFKAPVKMSREH